jgi:hypothetical protein
VVVVNVGHELVVVTVVGVPQQKRTSPGASCTSLSLAGLADPHTPVERAVS